MTNETDASLISNSDDRYAAVREMENPTLGQDGGFDPYSKVIHTQPENPAFRGSQPVQNNEESNHEKK